MTIFCHGGSKSSDSRKLYQIIRILPCPRKIKPLVNHKSISPILDITSFLLQMKQKCHFRNPTEIFARSNAISAVGISSRMQINLNIYLNTMIEWSYLYADARLFFHFILGGTTLSLKHIARALRHYNCLSKAVYSLERRKRENVWPSFCPFVVHQDGVTT